MSIILWNFSYLHSSETHSQNYEGVVENSSLLAITQVLLNDLDISMVLACSLKMHMYYYIIYCTKG